MMDDNKTTDNLESEIKSELREEKEEMSMEELLKTEGEFSEKLYKREIVSVKVVQVTEESVFVDICEKKEAVIPFSDFKNDKNKPQFGLIVEAVFERKGGETKHTVLSNKKARERVSWRLCEKMFKDKERGKGRILEVIKGGYMVEVFDIKGFMPLSLSEIGGAHKHYLPINARVKFYITDFSVGDKKIIVSRRQVLEEEEKDRKKKVFAEINSGRVVRTVVSKAIDEGLFVRFQGIEGIVRLSDVSWCNQEESLKTYERGQRIKCKILRIDHEQERISFGIKQLTPNPVDVLKRKFGYKSIIKAEVISSTKEGVRMKVSERVNGFVPSYEYGADGAPKEKEVISAVVIGVNSTTYELTLSVKKFEGLEDRKRIQGYMKGSPSLTLGQILQGAESSEE